jgi:hypothetical protein
MLHTGVKVNTRWKKRSSLMPDIIMAWQMHFMFDRSDQAM